MSIALIVSSILYLIRRSNGRGNKPGQWFADALTVGTIVIIVAIGAHAVLGDNGLGEVAKANMILIALAFINSSGVLVRGLIESARASDGQASAKAPI